MNVEQRRIQCWDVDAGYAAAWDRVRWPVSETRRDLLEQGYQEVGKFRCLSRIMGLLDDEIYITAQQIPELRNVFWHVFTTVKPLLREYYHSSSAPVFCSMLKMGPLANLSPVDDIDESYRWHVDNGPSCHLKLIIYLNDEHDGATTVMSRQDSRKFIDAGYLEGERLFHLDDFAKEHGISYTPYKVQPKAGSGIIFEPTNVLHKGVYSTFGERRVFQMGIIPWGKPWRDFYEEHWAKGYSSSNGFPRYDLGDGEKVA